MVGDASLLTMRPIGFGERSRVAEQISLLRRSVDFFKRAAKKRRGAVSAHGPFAGGYVCGTAVGKGAVMPNSNTKKMRFRRPLTITSRTSSITNSFVQAVVPSPETSADEWTQAFQIFEMDPESRTCVYCGALATDWDHLRPLVRNKRPTGYIDEIRNRVPSCAPCNQSKGGADWRKWMEGNARGSPKTKGINDLPARIERLERFEKWGQVKPLDFRALVGIEAWDAYWRDLDIIIEKMFDAQAQAVRVRTLLNTALNDKSGHTVQ